MKVAQLLREMGHEEVFHVGRRSDINRAVAAMSMASTIDFGIEYHPDRDTRNASVELVNHEGDVIRRILKKHSKLAPRRLSSLYMHTTFDSRKQLELLKAALEDIADELDPAEEDKPWPWLVSVSDDAWMFS